MILRSLILEVPQTYLLHACTKCQHSKKYVYTLILEIFFLKRSNNDDEDEFKSGFENELAAFDDEIEGNQNENLEIG